MILSMDTEGSNARHDPGAPVRPRVPTDARGHSVDLRPVEGLLAHIRQTCAPEQIWLFGSRARGEGRPGSDWDLFVVVPDDTDDERFDPRFAWRLQRTAGVRADIFFCRANDFHEDRDTVNTLAFDAAHEGVLIYER